MIKGMIFDFGNVICYFDNLIPAEKIGKLAGKSQEEIYNLVYKNPDLLKKFETGLLSEQEFFKELSDLCGINTSYEELKRIYSEDKFTPVEGMSELITCLKGKYKLGLLSNTSKWDFDYFLKCAPVVKIFDAITTSFEVKVMKPDPKIYWDSLNKLNLKPEECVYADDILEYVQAAKGLGINAIQFTDIENFKSDLENFGVELN